MLACGWHARGLKIYSIYKIYSIKIYKIYSIARSPYMATIYIALHKFVSLYGNFSGANLCILELCTILHWPLSQVCKL